jgi:hypothetical protein
MTSTSSFATGFALRQPGRCRMLALFDPGGMTIYLLDPYLQNLESFVRMKEEVL